MANLTEKARKLAAAEPTPPKTLTIVEQIEQKLDGAYSRWRRYRKHGDDIPEGVSVDMMQGRVQGLVEALTLLKYPATEEQVKATTLARWKERQAAIAPGGKFES